jgi:hypothetical protein
VIQMYSSLIAFKCNKILRDNEFNKLSDTTNKNALTLNKFQ